MGVVANFAELNSTHWPTVLSGVAAIGVVLADLGDDRGLRYCDCRRAECVVTLAFGEVVPGGGEGVCLYSPASAWWRHPLRMRRLSRDVWSAVLAAGGRAV
jgi:hypothetical protein